MSFYNFKVNIPPKEALELVKENENENADLVHEEIHDLEKGTCIGTLVFERYFMRVGNRAKEDLFHQFGIIRDDYSPKPHAYPDIGRLLRTMKERRIYFDGVLSLWRYIS